MWNEIKQKFTSAGALLNMAGTFSTAIGLMLLIEYDSAFFGIVFTIIGINAMIDGLILQAKKEN